MKKARIYWDTDHWILELFIDNDWHFSKSWGVKNIDLGYGEWYKYDAVDDDIICEIAKLQRLGYNVEVYVDF